FIFRNIAKIRSCLSKANAETLIYAFVSSRLDNCNVLFSGLPMRSLKKLQMVQNAAARSLTKTRKFDSIILYYLTLLQPYDLSRALRIPNCWLSVSSKSEQEISGISAFSHLAPVLWNSLP
ncbi:hypothetical protein LDENG_00264940, partial [Lucifuga dentata]